MGKTFASDKEIEIIFDAFYDCSQLPGMLNEGVQSLVSWGVPQVLVDKNVSVSINDQKAIWTVKTYAPFGLYGIYGKVSFDERFEYIKRGLEEQYSNFANRKSDIALCVTPIAHLTK